MVFWSEGRKKIYVLDIVCHNWTVRSLGEQYKSPSLSRSLPSLRIFFFFRFFCFWLKKWTSLKATSKQQDEVEAERSGANQMGRNRGRNQRKALDLFSIFFPLILDHSYWFTLIPLLSFSAGCYMLLPSSN